MTKFKLLLFISVVILSCESQKKDVTDLGITSKDEIDIVNTINNVYNNILVESDKKPDIDLIKEQFANNARMGYLKNDSLILKTPNEYFDGMKEMLSANNEIKYLKEWEIQGETKQFGNIAQRTSLYGVHFNTKDTLAEKGIINFQLVKINNRWQILSMIWQAEKEDLKVSVNYFN